MLNTGQAVETLDAQISNVLNQSFGRRNRSILHVGKNGEVLFDKMMTYHYGVLAFPSLEKACSYIEKEHEQTEELPCAIVCEIPEAKKSPDSTISIIKSKEPYDLIPFILISDHYSESDRKFALSLNVDDYFAQPLNAENLDFRINFLNTFNGLRKKEQQEGMNFESPKNNNLGVWSSKRTFDVMVAFLALLLLLPVSLVIALTIKLDSRGPIFYGSKRAGTGYKVFDLFQFRTMSGEKVTRFGKLLRKTKLDQAPQLINVLKGDMSLVGNIPLPLTRAEQLTKDQLSWRFLAPAGITGLWRIANKVKNGPTEEEMLILDIDYAKNNSFLYDIKIILKSVPTLFRPSEVCTGGAE